MNLTSRRVREITDGAIIVALYCVFFLISRLTGALLEYDLFFLMPLPIAIYSYKYSFRSGLIPLFGTSLLSIFICTSPFSSVTFVLPSLIIGNLFGGLLIKSKINSTITVLIMAVLCLISEILSSLVLSKILGIEDIFQDIKWMCEQLSNIIPGLNIPLFQAIMEGMIPSIFVILSLIESVCIYFLFYLIVSRIKMFSFNAKTPSFKFVSAPVWLTAIYLISLVWMIGGYILFLNENSFVHVLCLIGINLYIVLTIVFMYFGIKVASLYCRYKGFKWGIIILYVFILIPPLQLVLSTFGIIDSFTSSSKKLIEKIFAQK